jgi:ATP-binding cassette subfamily C protein CydC
VWLATIALAAMAAFEAVQPLPVAFERLANSLASAGRLHELTEAAPPVRDPSKPRTVRLGVLALEGAWLRYAPTGRWALAGVDFRLQPGRSVALVGSSGAGKTSVVNVLMRLRELDRGRATLAGHDLREYAQEDLRRLIGLCTQDPHLFNTSVRENLRLARPKATMAEIEAAAGTVGLLDWVRALPDGWDTMVGERGTSVSGGQRQRVALARALLAGSEVLILDEPTAHLDAETAASVMDDVLLAAAGKTLLVITHRLEGLERFDEVVIMADGRVVERCPADVETRPKAQVGAFE